MANIIQQLEDLKEWGHDPTRYARRLEFRSITPGMEVLPEEFDELSDREDEYYRKGPWKTSREDYQKGQLVEPGPGRPGYQGPPSFGGTKDVALPSELRKVTKKTHPHYGEWAWKVKVNGKKKVFHSKKKPKVANIVHTTKKYDKDPEYIKFRKENPNLRSWDAMRQYKTILARKNKIVGILELSKALGDDSSYSFRTLTRAWGDSTRKITKDMSKPDIQDIKNGRRIVKIITETLGEPTSLISTYTKPGGGTKSPVWDLNPSKIKKLNKELTKNYSKIGELQEKTINSIFNFNKNTKLMEAIDNYTGGKIKPGDAILEILGPEFKRSGRDPSYPLMQLARALRGEIQIEGIDKNLKRGNRIVKMMSKNWKGPLGNGFLQWAKLQMGKHFDDPNATYEKLTRNLKTSMREAGITGTTHIDEIFPMRTGQFTLGKGSGAYNHVIQLIDGKINVGAKVDFDKFATSRYKDIIQARKDGNWEKVKSLVDEHQNKIKDFYETNPQAKGKVKLTQLNYDPVKKRFASPTEIYGKDVFPSKIQKDMDKFYRKTGLSLDVGSTMTLEKVAKDPKTLNKFLKQAGFNIDKCLSEGGRVKLKLGKGVNTCITGVINDELKLAKKSGNVAKFSKFGKLARGAGYLVGWVDIPIELAFALPHLLAGNVQDAKAATTAGLFGYGGKKLAQIDQEKNPEAYKYFKHVQDINDWMDAFNQQQNAESKWGNVGEEYLEKYKKEGDPSGVMDRIVAQYDEAVAIQKEIGENYQGYVNEEGEEDLRLIDLGKEEGKKYLRETVKKDWEKGMDIDITMPDALPGGVHFNVAPFKEDKITSLEQQIKQKGESFYGGFMKPGVGAAAERLGAPDLYDDWYDAFYGKDPREAYSDLPLDWASQLAALEKKEWAEDPRTVQPSAAEEWIWNKKHGFAGGGIANVRRPNAIPPVSGPMPQGGGLSTMFNRVKPW
jgi:hypothetical protein